MNRPRIEVADLVVRYGDVIAVANVSFDIAPGEMVTLLGPSGCGKTTTLRAVAGLETPSGGTIRLNGETVYSANERRAVPAEKRGVSMVFQSYAIWPHMTVFENVAYGLRVRRLPQAEVRQNVQRVLEMVQMQDFADRPASKLSGGQQQRVAVARAIAFSPSVVLFDEPLSNLDAKLRAEMRVELRELQRRLDITSLYVTHDQEEALAISDRVIVMNGGRIEQIGTPEDIYNRPRTRFAADFVGSANLIAGEVRGPSGTERYTDLRCRRRDATGGRRVRCITRSENGGAAVILHPPWSNAGHAQCGCWSHPPPHVSRRLHSVCRGLASRPVDRPPPPDRAVRRRQRGDRVIRAGALRVAVARARVKRRGGTGEDLPLPSREGVGGRGFAPKPPSPASASAQPPSAAPARSAAASGPACPHPRAPPAAG